MFGGSLLRDFEDDPFFRGHNDLMSNFMSDFNHPFQSMFPAIGFGADRNPDPYGRRQLRQQQGQQMMPFQPRGMFDMFGQMDSMFANMQRQFNDMASNPDVHTYSSSTVMSYSNDGSGAPKVYQASSSTRQAPGGVSSASFIKETRKSVRDSQSGTQKMAIGHHIGDRSHVIERSRNVKSGEEEEKQDFVNLDELDAADFDREWRTRTNSNVASIGYRNGRRDYEHHGRQAPLAITGQGHYDRPSARQSQHQRQDDYPSVRGRQYERNQDWDATDRRNSKKGKKVRINSRPDYE